MSSQIQRITTKAIIHKEGKVLLVEDHNGKWEMPGGKIDFNESPNDTIQRELREELGFTNVMVENVVNVWSFSVTKDEVEYQFVVIVYSVKTDETEVVKSDEHKEYKWIPFSEVDSLNIREGYKESINKYLARLK